MRQRVIEPVCCEKCRRELDQLGEKIIIVHIGMERRDLCETCSLDTLDFIDYPDKTEGIEETLLENETANNII